MIAATPIAEHHYTIPDSASQIDRLVSELDHFSELVNAPGPDPFSWSVYDWNCFLERLPPESPLGLWIHLNFDPPLVDLADDLRDDCLLRDALALYRETGGGWNAILSDRTHPLHPRLLRQARCHCALHLYLYAEEGYRWVSSSPPELEDQDRDWEAIGDQLSTLTLAMLEEGEVSSADEWLASIKRTAIDPHSSHRLDAQALLADSELMDALLKTTRFDGSTVFFEVYAGDDLLAELLEESDEWEEVIKTINDFSEFGCRVHELVGLACLSYDEADWERLLEAIEMDPSHPLHAELMRLGEYPLAWLGGMLFLDQLMFSPDLLYHNEEFYRSLLESWRGSTRKARWVNSRDEQTRPTSPAFHRCC